jgi:hypothetical protein
MQSITSATFALCLWLHATYAQPFHENQEVACLSLIQKDARISSALQKSNAKNEPADEAGRDQNGSAANLRKILEKRASVIKSTRSDSDTDSDVEGEMDVEVDSDMDSDMNSPSVDETVRLKVGSGGKASLNVTSNRTRIKFRRKFDAESPRISAVEPKPPTAADMQKFQVLPQALREKVRRLAYMAQAWSSYCFAERKCDNSVAVEAQTAAAAVMKRVVSDSPKMAISLLHDVETLVILASQNQTAETMQANGALLTSTDIAELVQDFRGEEFGANFNYDPDMDSGKVKKYGRLAVQGDMLGRTSITTWKAKTIFEGSVGKPWSQGSVKYCFAHDVSPRVRSVFQAAVEQYTKAVPCLSIQEVGWVAGASHWAVDSAPEDHMCAESPAIFITSDPVLGCFSHIGMMEELPSQQLQLNEMGCAMLGSVVHQLGHALGLVHEHPHMRSYAYGDRIAKGRYYGIRDLPDDVAHWRFFYPTQKPPELLKQSGINYSPLSVMHLDPYAFSGERGKYGRKEDLRPVLIDADLNSNGQRAALARGDIQRLVDVYRCVETSMMERTGCLNGVSEKDEAVCSFIDSSSIQWCSLEDFSHCCACGGGVEIACFRGFSCPKRNMVSPYILHWREEGCILLVVCAAILFRLSPLAFRQAVYSMIYFLATLPLPIAVGAATFLLSITFNVGDRLSKSRQPKDKAEEPQASASSSFAASAECHDEALKDYLVKVETARARVDAAEKAATGSLFGASAEKSAELAVARNNLAILEKDTETLKAAGMLKEAAEAGYFADDTEHSHKEKQHEPFAKVLSEWVSGRNSVPNQGFVSTIKPVKPPTQRLSNEAFERFKGSFAPYAGGLSSGRDAPQVVIASGDTTTFDGPSWGQAFSTQVGAAGAKVFRLDHSDSSDPEGHRTPADPFEAFTEAVGLRRHESEEESSASDGERVKRRA